MKQKLTQEKLKRLLRYDPKTGHFYWRVARRGITKGMRAGYAVQRGYVYICIDRQMYLAHRLAWLYKKGGWPADELDHKNRRPSINKWSNLRLANSTLNKINSNLNSKNTSGYKGVTWNKKLKKWCARLYINKAPKALGFYTNKKHAALAYKLAAIKHYKEFAHV